MFKPPHPSSRSKEILFSFFLIALVLQSCRTSTFLTATEIKDGASYDAVQLSNGEVVRFSPPATYVARDSVLRGRTRFGEEVAIPLGRIATATTSGVTTASIVFGALVLGAVIYMILLFGKGSGTG